MSQATYSQFVEAAAGAGGRDGPAIFLTELNSLFAAFLTSHGETSRPTYSDAPSLEGLVWRNTTTGQLLLYDGTNDLPISVAGVSLYRHSELTIATGAITPAGAGLIPVDTEGDAASDDLDTITATNINDGEQIVLYAADDARTVVVKNGTGNIECGADFSLDDSADRITLEWDATGTRWLCVAQQSNG